MSDRIYSPSQTTDFSRCPTYWSTKRRWEPQPDAWSPERDIGKALHAGLAARWRQFLPGAPKGGLDPLSSASQQLVMDWPPDAPATYSREGALGTIAKLLDAFEKWAPTGMPGAVPVGVEKDYGEAIVDLETEEPDGLVLTDWKYAHNLPGDRVHYRLTPAPRTHQFWHYIWRAGQEYSRIVSRFRVVLLIGAPRILIRHTDFKVEPDALAAWLRGAEAKWAEMARIEPGPSMAIPRMNQTPIYRRQEGCYPFGEKHPCPFLDGCWRLHGDETKYEALYNRRV